MRSTEYREPEEWTQREKIVGAMAVFVQGLVPKWEDYGTFTFAAPYSQNAAVKAWERFMRTRLPGVRYFYAIEDNPSRQGTHVHALTRGLGIIRRKDVWKEWFELYGRNRITPILSRLIPVRTTSDGYEWRTDLIPDDGITVPAYVAKYVVKEGAWWNFSVPMNVPSFLLGHLDAGSLTGGSDGSCVVSQDGSLARSFTAAQGA